MPNIQPLHRQRIPSPDSPLVNREQEQALIQEKLNNGQSGEPMPQAVVCFWGAHGMGKSWLMYKLAERWRTPTPAPWRVPRPAAAAYVDVAFGEAPIWLHEGRSAVELGDTLNCSALLAEMWRQLRDQCDVAGIDLIDPTDDDWADAFVSHVSRLAVEAVTPVIMLDSVDELVERDLPAFRWLEERVLERLALTDRVLIVLASRGSPTYVRRWQLRRRIQSVQLHPFDKETATIQARSAGSLAGEIYGYSHGYPLATDFFAQMAQPGASELDEERRRVALDATVDEILAGVPDYELRREIALISVLRLVEAQAMLAVLKAAGSPLGRAGEQEMNDLIERLLRLRLLYWDGDRKSYSFDASVRQVLGDWLQLAEPTLCQRAHEAAEAYYAGDEQQAAPPIWSGPELIYHTVQSSASGKAADARLRKYLDAWNSSTDARVLRRLSGALANDEEIRTAASDKGLDLAGLIGEFGAPTAFH